MALNSADIDRDWHFHRFSRGAQPEAKRPQNLYVSGNCRLTQSNAESFRRGFRHLPDVTSREFRLPIALGKLA